MQAESLDVELGISSGLTAFRAAKCDLEDGAFLGMVLDSLDRLDIGERVVGWIGDGSPDLDHQGGKILISHLAHVDDGTSGGDVAGRVLDLAVSNRFLVEHASRKGDDEAKVNSKPLVLAPPAEGFLRGFRSLLPISEDEVPLDLDSVLPGQIQDFLNLIPAGVFPHALEDPVIDAFDTLGDLEAAAAFHRFDHLLVDGVHVELHSQR